MSRHYFTQCLLVFHLACATIVYSQTHYYIKPSQSSSCHRGPCVTLTQYAATFDNYSNGLGTNLSFSFLPGNHVLDRELSLTNLNNVSMITEAQDNRNVVIECPTMSESLTINYTVFVLIKDIHFIACGGVTVDNVEYLVVEDCSFRQVEGTGTPLALNQVVWVNIVRSSFIENLKNTTYQDKQNFSFYHPHFLCFEQEVSGGALYTSFSNVSIIDSKFVQNKANVGGAIAALNSSLHITRSTYENNQAHFGGVITTCESTVSIYNSTFTGNTAVFRGGVMETHKAMISISSSTMTNNSAFEAGAVSVYETFFIISATNFTNNSASIGGVITTLGESSFDITNCTFAYNSAAYFAGVVKALKSSFIVINSNFTNNGAINVLQADETLFIITNCTFSNNHAVYSGVIETYRSLFIIINSLFSATYGGVLEIIDSSFNIMNSTFSNNKASQRGSITQTWKSSVNITRATFTNNTAAEGGAIWSASESSITIESSKFNFNAANTFGVIYILQCTMVLSDSTFNHNSGSLYTFISNLTIRGYTVIENCTEPLTSQSENISQEGGAITSFLSTITFTGVSKVSNNKARRCGGILATKSKLEIYGEATIANNMATNGSGGGISLHTSNLEIKGKCNISSNFALWKGGGIHATSSAITVYQPGSLQFINNSAINGGGIFMEASTKLYILQLVGYLWKTEFLLTFIGNHANFGGAMYVEDSFSSAACLSGVECFIQILQIRQYGFNHTVFMLQNFEGNKAVVQGSNLFGGLLDRCIPSPFTEVYQHQTTHNSGFTSLMSTSNILIDSIASLPVQVCFCNGKGEPDCSYQPPPIVIVKGESFIVSVVAVDQVNHTVDANIISFLSSPGSRFAEGQQIQTVSRKCTELAFNVFSPYASERVNIYTDGPCQRAELSTSHITIHFLDCICPIGFEPLTSTTRCVCICDSKLSPYITSCNSHLGTLQRANTNSWITYVNTDTPGYVIHHCPFNYCQHPSENININFNFPEGSDAQCAHNRSGVLCGACQQNYSLSLGTSHCLKCYSHWHLHMVFVVILAIIAGILLVTAILSLNITVAVGLINSFILYANVVAVNNMVFFPSSDPSFPTVLVAWFNFDIGIDICFFNGLDAYTKTWIQMAFPLYIIFLAAMLIIVKAYSSRFARFIERRDPFSTLATIILLSYSKLLSVAVTALMFTTLQYPDGSQQTVWLPDGNLNYFQGKHVALAIVAAIIIISGVPYTIIVFSWRWVAQITRCSAFKWASNKCKLNSIISTYQAPYNTKYHYWTGLLLLVRVVLYLTKLFSASTNQESSLLITIIFIGSLFLLKTVIGLRVYKKPVVDVIESVVYFNILVSAAVTEFKLGTDIVKQTSVVYISTAITFILFIGVIVCHIALLIHKYKPLQVLNEYVLTPVQVGGAEETFTFSELTQPGQNHHNTVPLEISEDTMV